MPAEAVGNCHTLHIKQQLPGVHSHGQSPVGHAVLGGAAHQMKPMMSGSRMGRTQGTAMTTKRIAPAGSTGEGTGWQHQEAGQWAARHRLRH